MYQITEAELDTFYEAGNYKTLDVGMFSLSLGAALALGTTLATVDGIKPSLFATFWAATLVSALASIFFGVRALIAWKTAATNYRNFKKVH